MMLKKAIWLGLLSLVCFALGYFSRGRVVEQRLVELEGASGERLSSWVGASRETRTVRTVWATRTERTPAGVVVVVQTVERGEAAEVSAAVAEKTVERVEVIRWRESAVVSFGKSAPSVLSFGGAFGRDGGRWRPLVTVDVSRRVLGPIWLAAWGGVDPRSASTWIVGARVGVGW